MTAFLGLLSVIFDEVYAIEIKLYKMKIIKAGLVFLTIMLLNTACKNEGLVGKRFYILNGSVNSNYYASLKEIQLEFLSSDELEAKITMYADATGYELLSDGKDAQSEIVSYSFESGFLRIPKYGITTRLTKLGNGDFVTNENEYLYLTSIVEYLGTSKAVERLEQSSRGQSARIFKKFIQTPMKQSHRK